VRYLGDGSNYPGDNSDWTNAGPADAIVDLGWISFMQTWHFKQMVTQSMSLQEKMVLFWHNHFATGHNVVKDARYMFRTHQTIRTHALGNLRAFVKAITLDPGMLRYLDGNTNTKSGPNENYARELQELFTIGKGEEIAPGNYGTYTEHDIKQAARVLSGWSDEPKTLETLFNEGHHDDGDKPFSEAYGKKIIKGRNGKAGALEELDELIEMILQQPETAEYICRKIYRWFVSTEVTPQIETTIIKPLAKLYRESDYDVQPVMVKLLSSKHFYDPAIRGAMIKNPIDLSVGLIRSFPVDQLDDADNFMNDFPSTRPQLSSEIENIHYAFRRFHVALAGMQYDLHNPPSVAGLPAYYQEPQLQKLWINADTLQRRVKMVDDFLNKSYQFDDGYGKAIISAARFATQLSKPADPKVVIAEVIETLFAVPIPADQAEKATRILLDGIDEGIWAARWELYKQNQNDPGIAEGVAGPLRNAMRHLAGLAEFQLM
jgi:uncharacterized protein (DUF1800 family)